MNSLILKLKRVASGVKKILPSFIYNSFVKSASAFLTPIHFSSRSGHFKSSWKKQPITKNGAPIPWYTYPMIDFLKNRNFQNKTVLEWGGGNSSQWWAKRALHVVTLEHDQEWFKIIADQNQFTNLSIHPFDTRNYENSIQEVHTKISAININKFDIIIIDGMDRPKLVQPSIQLLKEDGIIIIDDSERYNFNGIFEANGFYRIDFFGYAPGVLLPKCTSIHFKKMSDIFSNQADLKMDHVRQKRIEKF